VVPDEVSSKRCGSFQVPRNKKWIEKTAT
jgi:hypothetical protein